MATEINLNQQISFILTDYGKMLYAKYDFLLMNKETTKNLDGTVTMSLWEFAQIFGEYLYLGNPQTVTVNNSITLI